MTARCYRTPRTARESKDPIASLTLSLERTGGGPNIPASASGRSMLIIHQPNELGTIMIALDVTQLRMLGAAATRIGELLDVDADPPFGSHETRALTIPLVPGIGEAPRRRRS